MNIFKLRIMADDQDDFIIELEIKSSQTFKVLHDFLVKSLKLNENELASFHIADDNRGSLHEITLLDMTGKDKGVDDNDDKLPNIYLMEKTRLENFISEIGQKIIYEYDFLQLHTFLIEVIDIDTADENEIFPQITFNSGKLSLRDKLSVEQDSEKLKQELLEEFNLMMKNENEPEEYNDIDSDDY